MHDDPYRAAADAYDLFAAPYRAAQQAALAEALPHFQPEVGAILDIGAGPGTAAVEILERLPEAHVLALEPSATMRALLLGRIAERTELHPRITVRPEAFFDAELPQQLGGAIMLGVLGHFDVMARKAVFAELARRLAPGAGVLTDLQLPQTPEPVPPHEFTAAQIGDVEYRGIAEAKPIDDEQMRWRMIYLTLAGERVLTEEWAEHTFNHPDPDRLKAEALDAGFDIKPTRTQMSRPLHSVRTFCESSCCPRSRAGRLVRS
ncbi:class I SAM-dependent methyltransferase [Brachybacterium sp. Marseille-Q7125]|uniref:class I SAM-dependent methyltransferase n=1 Tax=Brachybacterium sp. Marseille-Q7125 TaxID=2932815 RepID=UPI001FF1D82F|nr:class I SAM-dependent methyltransferase [Brachybacterium sp. Marseille-Q7125]